MGIKRKNAKGMIKPANEAADVEFSRLTRLLALLVVKGESQAEKIQMLSAVGFANTEIAELLGTTANAINVALHRLRTKK